MLGQVVSAEPGSIVIRSAADGSKFSLRAYDPKTGEATDLVPPMKDEVLDLAQRIGDRLFCRYVDDNQECRLRVFDLEGELLRTIEMAELGMPGASAISVGGLTGNKHSQRFTDFTVSSAAHPTQTYRVDLERLEVKRLAAPELDFDSSQVRHRGMDFTAADGTRVPLQHFERADGRNDFTLVFHYGSIGISSPPEWNIYAQMVLELGGSVAFVGVRGGGERGADWRDAGTIDRRLTLTDARDAGRFLREELGAENTVLYGRSWGGWSTAAVAALFPDAYSAYFSNVPGGLTDFDTPDMRWAKHDFGAGMDERGRATDLDRVSHHVSELNSEVLMQRMEPKEPPRITFGVQKDDDRTGPHTGYRMMNVLEERFGNDSWVQMPAMDGGHGARGDQRYIATFLASAFPGIEHRPLKRPTES